MANATQPPAASPDEAEKRDGLGQLCFWFHIGVMVFVVFGWLITSAHVLLFYVVFLPGMYLQWHFNKTSCVLNNIESLIRTGRWRNPSNREEGAWLRTLVEDVTGWQFTVRQMDAFNNAAIFLLWLLGLGHLLFWYVPDRLLNPS